MQNVMGGGGAGGGGGRGGAKRVYYGEFENRESSFPEYS